MCLVIKRLIHKLDCVGLNRVGLLYLSLVPIHNDGSLDCISWPVALFQFPKALSEKAAFVSKHLDQMTTFSRFPNDSHFSPGGELQVIYSIHLPQKVLDAFNTSPALGH